ncbi:MAG: hypothetical protein V4850_14480 [Myxococcota bacterium]
MPPLPPELAPYAPLLPILAAIVLPPAGGLVVGGVVRGLGLDDVALPGLPRFRWSLAAGAWTFLLAVCAVVGVYAGGAQDVVDDAVELLVRVGAAGCCLFVGAWASVAREGVSDRESRRGATAGVTNPLLGLAIGGVAALVVLVGAGGAVLLVGGVLVVLGVVALHGGEFGEVLRDALRDIAAGIELRARAAPGTEVHVDGRVSMIAARSGLLSTRLGDGQERNNRHVLAGLAVPVVKDEVG